MDVRFNWRPGRVTKSSLRRMILERSTREGDSPVAEKGEISVFIFLSTMGHVEPRGNLGGPPSKAKYTPATDSEQVP
jgi:hypothetical protein